MAPERRHRLALGDPNPAAPFSWLTNPCMNDATTSSRSRTRRYQHRSVGRRASEILDDLATAPRPPSAIPVQRHIHCPCPTLAAAAAGTASPKTYFTPAVLQEHSPPIRGFRVASGSRVQATPRRDGRRRVGGESQRASANQSRS
jgi:hypothetical protein